MRFNNSLPILLAVLVGGVVFGFVVAAGFNVTTPSLGSPQWSGAEVVGDPAAAQRVQVQARATIPSFADLAEGGHAGGRDRARCHHRAH